VGHPAQQKEAKLDFPSDEEIKLVVKQSERAFQQYAQSVELEAMLPSSKENGSGVATDKQVVAAAKELVDTLKQDPGAFHGLLGFTLQTMLDDASRNAALCGGSGMSELAMQITSNKVDKARAFEILGIAKACQDASTALYTVSETVHDMYVRELVSRDAVLEQLNAILQQPSPNSQPVSKH
jgi:hypothetical protein